MMGTEILKIDASWAEKLPKTRVSFLMTPTVYSVLFDNVNCMSQLSLNMKALDISK